uniref:Uncharacterized protein n=1 Tax=Tanacetum cinerariifolium TaxID=118510 RepID=A0A6L2K0X2_TANCI|nr:hypothetical protein [Tanacetum cinerariifolium]
MSSSNIQRHSRRSKSFSFSDISDDSSIETTITSPSPSTPLRYLGIPFSWEQVPGIAKKNNYKKSESSQNLLLPPPGNAINPSPMTKKYSSTRSFKKDPFFAAFVECSKDKNLENSKFSTGERSGFVVSMYTSCKRSCSVSESIVYRRRPDYL